MNTPITHEQVKNLPMGFNPTCFYHGTQKDNQTGKFVHVFHPNRKSRRLSMQKRSKNIAFGKPVSHYQSVVSKEGKLKQIVHLIIKKFK